MTKKLGSKQLLMITYFLKKENKWATPKEIKEYFKKKISNKTITNTLKCNDKNKTAPFFLFNINVSERGIIYRLISKIDIFIILAEDFLKSPHSLVFFESKYTQLFLKNNKEKILKKVIDNLLLDLDEESREKMWDVMIKSPSTLKYGLFGEKPEWEMEFFENVILSMLTDLKNGVFYFPRDFVNEKDSLQSMEITMEINEFYGKEGASLIYNFHFNYPK